MSFHPDRRDDPQRLLRGSLAANAAFSALSAAVFTLGAAPLAEFLGVPDPRQLIGVGVSLLGFAGFVAWLASRPSIPLPAAMGVVLGDLGWVVGTVPIVWLGLLSGAGAVAAIVVADIVLLFAALQLWGIQRVRRRPAAGTAPAH